MDGTPRLMTAHESSSARPYPVFGKLAKDTLAGATATCGAAAAGTITAGTTGGTTVGGTTKGDTTKGGTTTGGTIVGGTTTGGTTTGETTGGGTTGGGTTTGAAQVGLLRGLVSKVTAPLRAKTLPSTEAPVFTVTDAKAKIVPAKLEFVPSVADEPICQKTLQA